MKFKIIYTGKESFFQYFKINGKKTLPLAAYIEMIRAAGAKVNDGEINEIRNFKWNQPIVIEKVPLVLHIEFWKQKDGFLFELYEESNVDHKTIYAQGDLSNVFKNRPAKIKLDQLRSNDSVLNKEELYKQLAKNSLEYTNELQSINAVFQMQNQFWSKVIPKEEEEHYVLPLNIVESAFQTLNGQIAGTLRIESIEAMHIYGTIKNTAWCQVIKKEDIEGFYTVNLLSVEGEVLLVFEGVKLLSDVTVPELHYFEEKWEEIEELNQELNPFQGKKILCLGDDSDLIFDFKNALRKQDAEVIYSSFIEDINESFDCVFLFPTRSEMSNDIENRSYGKEEEFVFTGLKKVLGLKRNNVQIHLIVNQTQQVFSTDVLQEKGAGIFGLVGTVAAEMPTWNFRVVDINENEPIDFEKLAVRTGQINETLVAYRNGKFYKKLLSPVTELPTVSDSAKIRKNGTYVILGGAGGLGKITTEHLIKKYNARVFWLGRRPLDKMVETAIGDFSGYESKPFYIQCDANNPEDIKAAFEQIKADGGTINGVIHSALVLEDKPFYAMSLSDFTKAFAPKSTAVQNLMQVCKKEHLDFMCFFSSIQGFFNGPGQANYAAGCTYKNTLAKVIEQNYKIPVYTINWGYWGNIGAASDAKYEERMDQMGIGSIRAKEGMIALEKILGGEQKEIYAVKFSEKTIAKNLMSRIKKLSPLSATDEEKSVEAPFESEVSNREEHESIVLEKVQKIAAALIKLPQDEMDIDVPFSAMGYDSILSNQLSEYLNKELSIDIQPTDLFNYPSVRSLVQYIIENKEGWKDNLIESTTTDTSVLTAEKHIKIAAQEEPKETGDIAIVGMSGAYAGASNLEEYWEALQRGENLVRETPIERWDSRLHYSPVKGEEDKTYSKWGGFMKDIDKFDAGFFKISGIEAENMDPQQRLFLEHCWHALEDANLTQDHLDGKQVGVYAGVGNSDYIQNPKGKHVSVFWGMDNSILAARISYYLNLRGPALAIDSACSSSLVALEAACRNLQTGNIDMGICGGVSLTATPLFHKMASKAAMLSENGKCFTFDHRANGFVPGEGVGVIIVKRLKDALRDGDHIHAVIKGILTNQDGATNGILAPSAPSQEALEKQVYETFQIDPETISYVEAHGTGTKLGDPIEVEALTKAFGSKTQKKNFCGIGSVKTNIGHTLHAAGLAGLQKVILAMKHKQIPPSLNYEKNNAFIDFENSPFYVNTTLKPWNDFVGGKRRAAISSFGFSGTNAHAIIEEYIPVAIEKAEETNAKVIIAISAKDRMSLENYCKKVVQFVQDNSKEISLSSLAYTFQVGRTAMEERFACVVQNKEELLLKLNNFLNPENEKFKTSGFYINNIKVQENTTIKGISGKAFIDSAIKHAEVETVAELWTQGVKIDWELLYKQKQNKIKIPSYPFRRDRFWVEETEIQSQKPLQIHPLIHQNLSTLREQKFASYFDGNEYFIKEHVVNGSGLFPGAAYIEMGLAAGKIGTDSVINELYDITWQEPLRNKGKSTLVNTVISETANSEYHYQIFSAVADRKIIHSSGKLRKRISDSVPQERIEVDKIIADLPQFKGKKEIYKHFGALGFDYGTNFQGIENIRYSENKTLVELTFKKQNQFVLEPGALDSIFQCTIGLSLEGKTDKVYVPYSIKRLNIYKELPEKAWCLVELVATKSSTSGIRKYNMLLIDSAGETILKLDEFTLLPLENITTDKEEKSDGNQEGLYYFNNVWKSTTPRVIKNKENKELIYLAGFENTIEKSINSSNSDVRIIPNGHDPKDAFQIVFQELKKSIESKEEALISIVIENNNYHQYGHLAALLQSAQLEYSKVRGKVIVLDNTATKTLEEILQIVKVEKQLEGLEVRYLNVEREERVLEALTPEKQTPEVKIKEGGVYWITGGMGGLGQLFLKHILKTKNTKVVLTGRTMSSEDDTKITNAYSNVVYNSCDISDKDAVALQFQKIKQEFGNLNGIIHSAGLVRDGLLIHKSEEEAEAVLKPKIDGIRFLDEVTKDEKLDFFVSFSAVAAVMGNQGQCDYASANAYMDHFMAYRRTKCEQEKRFGKSISINWPLWENGGMKMSEDQKRYMRNQTGMVPMPNEIGTSSFDFIVSGRHTQLMPVYGLLEKIKIQKAINKEVTEEVSEKNDKEYSKDELKAFITSYLIDLLSEEFKLPKERFELHKYFEDFGIDSITITKLTNTFDEVFIDIPRSLFFEYQTLQELVGYFLEEQLETVKELLLKSKDSLAVLSHQKEDNKSFESEDVEEEFQNSDQLAKENRSEYQEDFSSPKISDREEKIAIIGLAGKYPGANNVDEFWENLKQGKDSITEIPGDRWDLTTFYDEEKGKSGKSYSKWGGFIEGVDKFDPRFFNISPREAEIMEPQERLFLQTAWETIEDAGYTREQLGLSTQTNEMTGNVGVFVGVMYEEYQLYGIEEQHKGNQIHLVGNPSSIANRVSYFFNFHGPSLAVDTMCSSSITAVELACQSIMNGDCKAAIAGGVNVSIHPNKYLLLSKAGFASSTGRCKSFGVGGDGYVPSEGVGAVLLKKLSDAERDGDQIYGVIRGASLNHGGKTNGYTVPNPKAQTAVIKRAMEKANLNANEISYVEAHGTGTSLGDPIEVTSLKKAFQTEDKDFICKIGSVKSNIGHCESAAGISGITKVLLQLKHKQLVPSIHAEEQNANINFNNTPFRVQKTLELWDTNGTPRIAGISSFGAGGSNAHLIIEEYTGQEKNYSDDQVIPLWVISAKSEEQLKEYAEKLLNWIKNQEKLLPQEVAYTLQAGREAMSHRLAFYALTIEEGIAQLNAFLDGISLDYYSGTTDSETLVLEDVTDAEIKRLWGNRDSKIAELWCSGRKMEWSLYHDKKQLPRKISLPTYPFAKKYCWFTKMDEANKMEVKPNGIGQIHPILHKNISDLDGVKFQSDFLGNETFLKDHIVNAEKLFPGVAYLELARKALEEVTNQEVCQLKDITWLKPLKVEDGVKQITTVVSKDKNEILVQISSTEEGKNVLHAEVKLGRENVKQPAQYIISVLKERMSGEKEGKECYEAFKTVGLAYGGSFQGIKKMYFNEQESLVRIDLPTQEGIITELGILDTALQATIGVDYTNKEGGIQLPYSLQAIDFYTADISGACWCYVQKHKERSKVHRYSIQLLDQEGNVLAEMRDFVSIELRSASKTVQEKEDSNAIGVYYESIWEKTVFEKATLATAENNAFIGAKNEYSLLLEKEIKANGGNVIWYSDVTEIPVGIKSVYFLQGLWDSGEKRELTEQIEKTELNVFNNVKALQKRSAEKLEVVFVTKQTQKVTHSDTVTEKGAGIVGFVGSLVKEEMNWTIKSLDVSDPNDMKSVLQAPFSKMGESLAIRNLDFYQNILIPVENKIGAPYSKLRKGGVYVILGGAGGLGKVTTAYLVKKYQAKVYWLGRREQDEAITASIEEIAQYGVSPTYIQCDAGNKLSMQAAYTQIKLTSEEINGIFHSAIVLNDKVIANMKEEDFTKSFYPKSVGSQYLIDAFSQEELDFICFYSSAQSFFRAAGQSNYSAGCTYKDSLAKQIQQKSGIPTYVIHWGYWGNIGIVSSKDYEQRMQQMGIGSIDEAEGMQALEKVFTQKNGQLFVMKFLNDAVIKRMNLFQLNKRKVQTQKVAAIELKRIKLTPSKQILN
ncbi:SDR family NAD(P)-dependent oxidoreductase [Flavobacterium poyangense]|uniref:SDR family NAD(P)-dependent oxidoreductase n=1 Tax=Flavobacterium poyangense TaxID=2204302 RepID=UPI00141E1B69|nr:SDR family NAD(P)-dependent oxidoreductase [Flavobacterium sp. JXAS1]